MRGEIVADVFLRVALDDFVLFGWEEVVSHGMESDAPPLDGFQAEKRVVDAAQPPGRDEDERVAVPCHVVDGQQAACEGNHQATRTFEQDSVEAAR